MKHHRILLAPRQARRSPLQLLFRTLAAAILAAAGAHAQTSEPLAIQNAGFHSGGVSHVGTYQLQNSIGAAAGGYSYSASFTLQAGFPEVLGLVQSADLPKLHARRTKDHGIMIYWKIIKEKFELQACDALTAKPAWKAVALRVQSDGDYQYVTFPTDYPQQYYRLSRTED